MTNFTAVIMHGTRDTEGRYAFEGPEDLLSKTPVRVMKTFMDYVEEHAHIGHIDYAINAAMKNDGAGIVTVLGELHFEHNSNQPFMCMISKDEQQ